MLHTSSVFKLWTTYIKVFIGLIKFKNELYFLTIWIIKDFILIESLGLEQHKMFTSA